MKEELLNAMRRLAARRFDTRLPADQNAEDSHELSELAGAFNDMSESLGMQFAAITALAEIDRLISESPGLERILDALMAQLREVIYCDSVAVMLIDGDDHGHARLYINAGLRGARHEIERVALPENFGGFKDGETLQLDGAALRGPCAENLARRGMKRVVLQAVNGAQGMVAVLAIGTRELRDLSSQHKDFARAFAQRLTVALTNIDREARLHHQAYYDPLTNLPNRQLFKDRLDREMARAARAQETLALLYVDLDQFKHLNDSLGHAAGDELLQLAAARLRSTVKDTDTVARLGGDEFVIVLPQLSTPAAVTNICERILTELNKPMHLCGQNHYISASIGVAVFPDDGNNCETLLRNADVAMYRAKQQGRSRMMFFESHMNTRAMERWSLETGLHRALQARQFVLYYQPQIELSGGALSSAEALIRWNSPNRGQRGPAEFLPVAAESGLILDIGLWTLNEACRQYADWRRQGEAPPRLSINVSPEQLRHPNFLNSVRDALLRAEMPPWALELEFTEAQLLDDPERVSVALKGLAELGVKLSIDDFGTGFSSLGHLQRYPIETVKIDRSLVAELADNSQAKSMATAIVLMARSLGKQTAAEGVETADQLDYLRALKCDFGQGYYLAKPMPAQEFMQYMRGRQAPSAMTNEALVDKLPAVSGRGSAA